MKALPFRYPLLPTPDPGNPFTVGVAEFIQVMVMTVGGLLMQLEQPSTSQ